MMERMIKTLCDRVFDIETGSSYMRLYFPSTDKIRWFLFDGNFNYNLVIKETERLEKEYQLMLKDE